METVERLEGLAAGMAHPLVRAAVEIAVAAERLRILLHRDAAANAANHAVVVLEEPEVVGLEAAVARFREMAEW